MSLQKPFERSKAIFAANISRKRIPSDCMVQKRRETIEVCGCSLSCKTIFEFVVCRLVSEILGYWNWISVSYVQKRHLSRVAVTVFPCRKFTASADCNSFAFNFFPAENTNDEEKISSKLTGGSNESLLSLIVSCPALSSMMCLGAEWPYGDDGRCWCCEIEALAYGFDAAVNCSVGLCGFVCTRIKYRHLSRFV